MVHSRRRSLSSHAFPFLVQVSLLTCVRHKIPRKSHATNLKMRSGVGVPKGLAATSLASSQTKRRRRRTPRTPRRLENASTNRRNDGSPVSVAGERRHPHVSCSSSSSSSSSSVSSSSSAPVPLDALKVAELRARLAQRRLKVSGKKAELIERLRDALAKEEEAEDGKGKGLPEHHHHHHHRTRSKSDEKSRSDDTKNPPPSSSAFSSSSPPPPVSSCCCCCSCETPTPTPRSWRVY